MLEGHHLKTKSVAMMIAEKKDKQKVIAECHAKL